MEKLDRILISVEVESDFPTVFVRTLPRVLFDHSPLIMDVNSAKVQKVSIFIFKLSWFMRSDLGAVVTKS